MTIIKKLHLCAIPHESNGFKPHFVRHKSLVIYSILLIIVKVAVLSSLLFTYPTQAEFSTITINRISELTNKSRQEHGLVVLKHNKVLDLAAQKKAEDMLKNNYFAHTSPDGIKPWYWFKEVGYNYTFAGENLAMNFIEAEDAIDAWLNSPSHRDNILSENYQDIGVAVAVGVLEGRETTLVVQLFGKTYSSVAGEIFAPSSRPIESEIVTGPVNVIEKAATQEVKLEKIKQSSLIAKLVKYSETFFFVLLGFVILNLILTIIIRVEIQHKPVIMHCLFVILLALVMIFLKLHFVEGLDLAMSII